MVPSYGKGTFNFIRDYPISQTEVERLDSHQQRERSGGSFIFQKCSMSTCFISVVLVGIVNIFTCWQRFRTNQVKIKRKTHAETVMFGKCYRPSLSTPRTQQSLAKTGRHSEPFLDGVLLHLLWLTRLSCCVSHSHVLVEATGQT